MRSIILLGVLFLAPAQTFGRQAAGRPSVPRAGDPVTVAQLDSLQTNGVTVVEVSD